MLASEKPAKTLQFGELDVALVERLSQLLPLTKQCLSLQKQYFDPLSVDNLSAPCLQVSRILSARLEAMARSRDHVTELTNPTDQAKPEVCSAPIAPPASTLTKRPSASAYRRLLTNMMATLPPKYRSPPHQSLVEALLRALIRAPEGLDLIALQQHCPNKAKCTEYLSVLMRVQHVVKVSRKGVLYKLHHERLL